MMDMNEKNEFLELLLKAHEGTLNSDEMRTLNDRIKTDDTAAFLYAEFFDTVSGLVDLSEMPLSFEKDDQTGLDTWINFLAQDEKSAPAIEVPKEESEKTVVQKVVYSKHPRHISKWNIYSAVLSAAAILTLILFINFTPNHISREVVTLTSSMNAEWIDVDNTMQNGARLLNDKKPFLLRNGLAELLFDTNARVVIEGPAEFQIYDDDRIALRYGKIYAVVPQEAIGFTVNAPSAQIIDMGTEFGVEADTYGNTYLHMIKGKTALIAGEKSNKIRMEVSTGFAKKISGDTQTVSDIPCNETSFVRSFDFEKKVVWRKQPSLDLADIVRAGNGLGTGNSTVRLDPKEGFTEIWHGGFHVAKGYLPIPSHSFIDGIFIPDGDTPQVVSSRGDVFEECPDTSGIYNMDLLANPKAEIFRTDLREGTIQFNGRDYTEESGRSCIVMHANHGLTFDLEAIRRSFNRDIARFSAQVGIADLKEDCPCNADFWVLVDGQVRYSLRQYKQKGVLNDVAVDIKNTDRFLTLVTTDGGDPDNPQGSFYERAISCDWCIFTEPVLILEERNK